MKKGKKRPEICLLLKCRTMEELKAELNLFGEDCQAVQWSPEKNSGIENYTKEEFVQMLKLVKTMCRGKKFIFQYYDVNDEETMNRLLRYAMGVADCIDIDLKNSEVKQLLREAHRKHTQTMLASPKQQTNQSPAKSYFPYTHVIDLVLPTD